MEDKNSQYLNWDLIFNSISDAIFIADKNNNIIKANTAFARLLNMTVENIIGKKCYELVHRSKTPWPSCPFEKSKKDGKVHTEEVDDPGIGVPLLVTTSPIFNPAGEIIGVAHVSKDITAIKNMENELKNRIEELQRFQKITVGRELKMKELKVRLAELEAKIEAFKEK